MTYISHYGSPLGGITLAATNDRLCGLWFDGQKYFGSTLREETEEKEIPVLCQTRHWLDIYFPEKSPASFPRFVLMVPLSNKPSGTSCPVSPTEKPRLTKKWPQKPPVGSDVLTWLPRQ